MATISEYLEIVLEGGDLSLEQARGLLDTIFEGEVEDVQIAAFLAAMRAKGASPVELAGLASSLRGHAVRVEGGVANLVDTCGTGGARLKTFNISTASAIVVAGAGVTVAKHGNKGITSNCGSADVLEALGVNIAPGPDVVGECIREAGIGFMFAPKFHPAMKYVQPIRKLLGFRTVFNILGPLANPAGAGAQVMGVADESLMGKIIETLKELGVGRAMVVHSDGLDEISTMGTTKILELNGGEITASQVNPLDFGFDPADYESLKGGNAAVNAEIVRGVICGSDTGPRRDIVVINAAAALVVAGLADGFKEGIELADNSIGDGKAKAVLDKFIEVSNK